MISLPQLSIIVFAGLSLLVMLHALLRHHAHRAICAYYDRQPRPAPSEPASGPMEAIDHQLDLYELERREREHGRYRLPWHQGFRPVPHWMMREWLRYRGQQ